MSLQRFTTGFIVALSTVLFSCRKSDYIIDQEVSVRDLGGGTGTVTWSSDRDYLISGFVFVNDGQTLTIEPGTVVRAKTGQGSLASALIVARGGTLIAEGERDRPIIFTVEGDDLQGSIPVETRGLWGGVILLGNATINTPSGEDMIEGIPISEPRGVYGGPDDDDNSGILRYVSIRHGGTNIGEGNEINGLTLGGVGRQTIIDHVEVISNADDGIEFFGGDVNCRNLTVAFCGDDGFDMDQGYHGKGQFWLCVNSLDSDQCAEISGGLQPVASLPGNYPLIYNATWIGHPGSAAGPRVRFLQYGSGTFRNSILLNPGMGVAVRYTDQPGDSYALFESGKLQWQSNVFYPLPEPMPGFYTYSELGEDLFEQNSRMSDSLLAWNTDFNDPGISFGEVINLLPSDTRFDQMAPLSHDWFEGVTYKGAFGSALWIEGWTLLHQSKYLIDN